jgi:hypothetical protein
MKRKDSVMANQEKPEGLAGWLQIGTGFLRSAGIIEPSAKKEVPTQEQLVKDIEDTDSMMNKGLPEEVIAQRNGKSLQSSRLNNEEHIDERLQMELLASVSKDKSPYAIFVKTVASLQKTNQGPIHNIYESAFILLDDMHSISRKQVLEDLKISLDMLAQQKAKKEVSTNERVKQAMDKSKTEAELLRAKSKQLAMQIIDLKNELEKVDDDIAKKDNEVVQETNKIEADFSNFLFNYSMVVDPLQRKYDDIALVIGPADVAMSPVINMESNSNSKK